MLYNTSYHYILSIITYIKDKISLFEFGPPTNEESNSYPLELKKNSSSYLMSHSSSKFISANATFFDERILLNSK